MICGFPRRATQQAALARAHGIHGFCYYYYWFAGKRLLERPIEEMRATGNPDFPVLFLLGQRELDPALGRCRSRNPDRTEPVACRRRATDPRLAAAFPRPAVHRVGGRPLFMVYRVEVLPDVRASAAIWRDICRREGIGDLYLCAAKTYGTGDPAQYGFDAVVEFPPHGMRTPPINPQVDLVNPDFDGQIVDYRQFVLDSLARPEPPYRVHRTVMPGWDNTARRPNHGPDVSSTRRRKFTNSGCGRLSREPWNGNRATSGWSSSTHGTNGPRPRISNPTGARTTNSCAPRRAR